MMNIVPAPVSPLKRIVNRLQALAPLDERELAMLEIATRTAREIPQRREILTEGHAIREGAMLLEGWACRVRIVADGRRQILGFVLPGELLGICRHSHPVALTTTVALTKVVLCPAPVPQDRANGCGLDEAYAVSAALEESYLLRQITRLGRLSAYERLVDWLMELFERVELGVGQKLDTIALPMTQEVIADALGLTNVHVNRTLQAMRRDKLIELRAGTVTLLDRRRCSSLVDWRRPGLTNGGVAQVVRAQQLTG